MRLNLILDSKMKKRLKEARKKGREVDRKKQRRKEEMEQDEGKERRKREKGIKYRDRYIGSDFGGKNI